jgi:hypothetical protein
MSKILSEKDKSIKVAEYNIIYIIYLIKNLLES